jgi:hypothetical protein
VIAGRELRDHRAVQAGVLVELTVQRLGPHPVGEFLGPLEAVDVDEGVVNELVADAVALQPGAEPVVAVQAELETEGRPGGTRTWQSPSSGSMK